MASVRIAQGQTGAIVIRALTANNCVIVQNGRVETVKMVRYGDFMRLLSYLEIGMLYVYSNLTYTHTYTPKCWYTNDRLKAPQMTVS